MPQFIKRFLAILHWGYVCEMSNDEQDYHDYTDTLEKLPHHMMKLTCSRCGKSFFI